MGTMIREQTAEINQSVTSINLSVIASKMFIQSLWVQSLWVPVRLSFFNFSENYSNAEVIGVYETGNEWKCNNIRFY